MRGEKKRDKGEIEKRRHLYFGFIKETRVAINNFKHIHFVKNNYSHKRNRRKRLDVIIYTAVNE